MLLGQVTKDHDKDRNKYFGDSRIEVQVLNQDIQQGVIEKKINGNYQDIAHQLHIRS